MRCSVRPLCHAAATSPRPGRNAARLVSRTMLVGEKRVEVSRVPTTSRHTRRSDPGQVFLNIPYDRRYEPLFLALIAGLAGLGFTPRCVLEIPHQQNRLQRIFELMTSCASSVHDLSRTSVSRAAPRCPRFNMPFELGLAIAHTLKAGGHQWIAIEEKRYRLQKSLSDLNGFDPYIHGGTPTGVLRVISDAFMVG